MSNVSRTTAAAAAVESLYGKTWMRFEAWESEDCIFWLDSEGVAAYARFDDNDADGLTFFEVRDQGQGIGTTLIAELREERPGLFLAGDIDSADCARFWHRLGFEVDGCELSNGRVWYAA